ncbi:hypothetical protein KIW84_031316 [Lathyrus oleraceus]|uniref:Uncharacterized protein n=1 Tax=Pisum sativum TaxID=3888 RepID=A0A9D4XST2_PEA|nr:hypothetical protein KIW84_031316 [Pisum sativum]
MLLHSVRVYSWPASLIYMVDKWCRNFIWSVDIHKRKLVTVAWNQCCKAYNSGGMGLRNTCNAAAGSDMWEFQILKNFNAQIHPPRHKIMKEVLWCPHLVDWIKVNIDSAFSGSPVKAACGGFSHYLCNLWLESDSLLPVKAFNNSSFVLWKL